MIPTGVVRPYGDAAVLVTYAARGREAAWATAQAVAAGLLGAKPAGLRDVVATFETVFVAFDPLVATARQIEEEVRRWEQCPPASPMADEIEIPIRYGGEDGPDLEQAAAAAGMTPDGLIRFHSESIWTIRFFAAPVGAPMMDGPSFPRRVPRRAEPRIRVAAGSVGISGDQTVIYPVESPGGWQIIGRTSARLLDPEATPMTAYRPGDRVCFRA